MTEGYPESDNPCLMNALIIKESTTDHLYLRMDLILRLVKRYLAENSQLALRFAREEDAQFFLECFDLHGCQVEQHTWG